MSPPRRFHPRLILTRLVLGNLLLMSQPFATSGVVFLSTGDPGYNTTEPDGALSGSGWQLQGNWQQFLGTPIAPNLFITAKHVGGAVGTEFEFQGVSYETIDSYTAPNCDLRIFRVCGTFPAFAGIYSQTNEVGKPMVVFGRGTRRGEDVTVLDNEQVVLKGWKWGSGDGVRRWGENTLSGVEDGGEGVGDLLQAGFDGNAGPNECHLTTGDSGGAVFMLDDDAQWKLAGINYAVDGPFNTSTNGTGFNAAIFDQGGLYTRSSDGLWELQPDRPSDKPSAFYATRLSSNISWIQEIIEQQGGLSVPVLQSTTSLNRPFRNHSGYTVDTDQRRILVPLPDQTLFIRLGDCNGVEILGSEIIEGQWIIYYSPQ